ncbi:MAG TPA: antitoxin Xre/MbcA/ParS toxin-binding domain-containing protein [Mucilaginibacter sp.]|jgi:putative toxin-antitoxin system antitoxin component (TIGR02293 family)
MNTFVKEPKLGAQFLSSYQEISDRLGGKELLGKSINNDYDLFDLLESGLTKKVLLRLKAFTGLNLGALATICNITPRTVQLKDDDYHFDSQISEVMIDLTDLFIIGIKLFSTNSAFIEWMVQPLKTLEGKEPIDLLVNSVGRKLVKDELIMFATGVYR